MDTELTAEKYKAQQKEKRKIIKKLFKIFNGKTTEYTENVIRRFKGELPYKSIIKNTN